MKKSKKIGIINVAPAGHVKPTLEFVDQLSRRGHTVDYLIPDHAVPMLRGSSANVYAYNTSLQQRVKGKEMPEPRSISSIARISIISAGFHMLPFLFKYCATRKPDVLVFDKLCWTAKLCAKAYDIPSAMLHASWCGLANGKSLDPLFDIEKDCVSRSRFEAEISKLGKKHSVGINNIDDAFCDHESCNIIFMSKHFHPWGDSLGPGYNFVGAQMAPSARKVRTKKKTLYVSFGTIYNKGLGNYLGLLDSFRESDWDVTISAGDYDFSSFIEGTSSNFTLASNTDQLDVLSRATAFVTHGGMGSVQEAIWFEVPMLVVPQAFDQFTIANRVVELGCGLSAFDSDICCTPDSLRDAVETISALPDFRESLRRERCQSSASGGSERVAEIIEAVGS